ncbi:hypothetical protein RJ639_033003 [Escallonia herrerae]|uniref:MADS-box domain-containing protein n=1 Tax=Escallonia herrerae TaxID=1293975 RepID=A0AA89BLC9_9ASTE|nr:hypothetical protein RJ639_033003 [Escallonia herrerae]
MGRRKVEMKRIEDKSSRQVTFSKRRGGLMKKARELSVLCGVDVGVVVFSCRGKLYDFCSGTYRSVFLPAQTCLRICSSLISLFACFRSPSCFLSRDLVAYYDIVF